MSDLNHPPTAVGGIRKTVQSYPGVHVTERVSKRLTNESATCLRARYCIDLVCSDFESEHSDPGESRFDLRVAMVFLLPLARWPGFEAARVEVCGDVTPRFGERGESARRERLNERIADDGGFSRAGH